jgi:hypothetical protein
MLRGPQQTASDRGIEAAGELLPGREEGTLRRMARSCCAHGNGRTEWTRGIGTSRVRGDRGQATSLVVCTTDCGRPGGRIDGFRVERDTLGSTDRHIRRRREAG